MLFQAGRPSTGFTTRLNKGIGQRLASSRDVIQGAISVRFIEKIDWIIIEPLRRIISRFTID
jgi:hypothetical protein